ncbi:serine hydrolase domain-containing protein [Zhongshania borealis]|uniref:EstA family serine hydrolase n=1 Tax=Zhongshania borealis TaxID=889488 RepID=A0ABP7X710_9GAMM
MSVIPCANTITRRIFRAPQLSTQINLPLTIDPAEQLVAGIDVEAIWAKAEALHNSGMHPMVSMCLRYQGKTVLHRSIGQARGLNGVEPRAAQLDTPLCLFSASKVVSAVLIHKLAEDGLLNLLNPVSYYIPAFAQNGKANISVYQLLAHRAGVPGVPPGTSPSVLFDHQESLRLICEQPPLCSDGRILAYHAITGGIIITELVKVCTGLSINEYLDKVIRKPMGFKSFTFGMPKAMRGTEAQNYKSGLPNVSIVGKKLETILGADVDTVVELSNTDDFLDATIPSGNLYATADEACQFFQMLLQQGEWQGKQILSPLTVYRLTSEASRPQHDRSLIIPMRYSAGAMLGGRIFGLYGRDTPYAFGHLGFSNIVCWADPQRDISVSLLNNGKPVIGNHILNILGLMESIRTNFPQKEDIAGWSGNFGQHELTMG